MTIEAFAILGLIVDIWIVSIILLITLFLLITEKIPIDLTSIGLIVVLILTRLLAPKEAVSGLANPAVITVGCMFLISEGMIRTGVIAYIGQKVIQLSKGNAKIALVIILLTVAVASAFMNNTPIVVLFIPVVMTMCCEFGLSPSQFLIPVSYASILAGTATLTGTSTNIIISDLSAASGYGNLGMFELSVVGLPVAVTGLVFIFLFSFKIMPSMVNPTCEFTDDDKYKYLAEVCIPRGSLLVDQNPNTAFTASGASIEVLELVRYSHVFYPTRDPVVMAPDDRLLIKGTANEILDVLQTGGVELPLSEQGLTFEKERQNTMLVELIIPPQSEMVGQRLNETALIRDKDLHIIAIKRSNLQYTEQKLKDIQLKTGDILLLWCTLSRLDKIRADADVIIVENVHFKIINRKKASISTAIFAGFLFSVTAGFADIMVCALAAVFLMAASGCLELRFAYRSLQPKVLLLIAATIGLGTALDKTGASQFYANAFLSVFSDLPPVLILGGIILMTSISTQLLSNNATAVLILPLAISIAVRLGLDPKPFIVAVCFGASACFATPIGYQTNLLVFGPGGYRFADYLKLGLPLNLIVLGISTLLIPYFWPF